MNVGEFFKGKRVLITGGAGFLGSNLAHALVAFGADVTVLDALLPLYGGNMFNLDGILDAVTFVHGDIRDQELVRTHVADKDIVYMFAAQVSYIDAKKEPFLDLDINGRGHLITLEAVKDYCPRARVLFSSSRLVYGKIMTIPVHEDHPTNPLSLYGIHKLLGEKYCRYVSDTYGVHTVSVRIPNPYGPRQQMKHNKYSIVGWFVRQAMEGKQIEIFGDGSQERDYIYVDDITRAFLMLTLNGTSGDTYNIGTKERIRFIDMVDAILREVGSGSKVNVPWPEQYEKNETGNYIADTSHIEQDTRSNDDEGWRPAISLDEGIRGMVTYYNKFKSHYW